MSSRVPRTWALRRDTLGRLAAAGNSGTIKQLDSFRDDLDAALDGGQLELQHWAELKFSCSSILINLGSDLENSAAVSAGVEAAQEALTRIDYPALTPQLDYNIANGLDVLHRIDRIAWSKQQPNTPWTLFNLKDRERLRASRAGFFRIGHSNAHADTRGRALCNLGNALDHASDAGGRLDGLIHHADHGSNYTAMVYTD